MNPAGIERQIEGGVAQGPGQALSEEIVLNEGRVANPNLTDYRMPTAMDGPRIESILVECASAAGLRTPPPLATANPKVQALT
jgi:CO/xanthine dehydrogenase Mo-binding subunit